MTTLVKADTQDVAWRKVCALVSGAALGPTAEVLAEAGVLARLLVEDSTEDLADLAGAAGLHPSYTHVAAHLLATQGLLQISEKAGAVHVALSREGRAWAHHADLYRGFSDRIQRAYRVRQAVLNREQGGASLLETRLEPGSDLEARIGLHLRGPLLAAIWGGLGRLGILTAVFRARLGWVGIEDLGPPGAMRTLVVETLSGIGWLRQDDDLIALSAEGRAAAQWAPLFNYVFGYLSVYERAARLLRQLPVETARDPEQVAMERDLLLSGKSHVFRTGLQAPLQECLLEVLDEALPTAIVDMNAGDGNVLEVVAGLVESRGRDIPVRYVALVRNDLAADKCRQRISGCGINGLVIKADFSYPDRVAAAMRDRGVSLRDSLVLSKTTIHDRRYRGEVESCLQAPTGSVSQAVFVSPEGEWISPAEMEDDLAAFFARWRMQLGRWGIVAIDTHAVPPEIAARNWEENVVSHVAASHGYSSQYLIESDRFREAARRAGLVSRFSRDLGTNRVDAVTMTLDYFVPE